MAAKVGDDVDGGGGNGGDGVDGSGDIGGDAVDRRWRRRR